MTDGEAGGPTALAAIPAPPLVGRGRPSFRLSVPAEPPVAISGLRRREGVDFASALEAAWREDARALWRAEGLRLSRLLAALAQDPHAWRDRVAACFVASELARREAFFDRIEARPLTPGSAAPSSPTRTRRRSWPAPARARPASSSPRPPTS